MNRLAMLCAVMWGALWVTLIYCAKIPPSIGSTYVLGTFHGLFLAMAVAVVAERKADGQASS